LRAIAVRIWRSLLVVSGIILAIAFLSYILCSDRFARHVPERGSPTLIERLSRTGLLDAESAADQRVQTFWMVGLALLISFVGITNAMLMSVTERVREIGTLKCLGALDRFVVRLFLLESVLVGLIGSLLGAVIGYVFTLLQVGLVLEFSMLSASFCLDALRKVPVAVGLGTVLTVLAAIYPAYVAARMKPVDAMRVEV